jgi:hypothetical protein
VQATFDKAALVQRCQLYKLRNVMDHLPERQRPWVQATAARSHAPSRDPEFNTILARLQQKLEAARRSIREYEAAATQG